MKTKILLTALAACTALSTVSAAAATLQVDYDAVGGPTQADFTSWDPPHADNTGLNQTGSFTYSGATDGSVEVTLTSSSDTYERNFGAVSGGAFVGQSNLLKDIVFFNQGNSGTNFIQVVLNDLKAGDYTFTGYHHSTGTLNSLATVNIFLNGADTGDDATQTQGVAPASIGTSVVNFTVANDDDVVTIRYQDPSNRHFGLNGFEIVPEPSSLALLVIGGLCVLRRRRGA